MSQLFGAHPDVRKQNILPAVSDGLYARIQALQDLYQVDGKPMSIEMLIDRSLSAYVDANPIEEGDLNGR